MVQLTLSSSRVEFSRGKFDNWCVYIIKDGQKKKAPTDIDYFQFFKDLDENFPELNVYNVFVEIYNKTGKDLDLSVIEYICQVATNNDFEMDTLIRRKLEGYLVVIYMAMIAEENKANTKLGKRIKRLGMHNLLEDGMTAEESANASRGFPWRELDERMKDRGF